MSFGSSAVGENFGSSSGIETFRQSRRRRERVYGVGIRVSAGEAVEDGAEGIGVGAGVGTREGEQPPVAQFI
jgi:hypothetical protein